MYTHGSVRERKDGEVAPCPSRHATDILRDQIISNRAGYLCRMLENHHDDAHHSTPGAPRRWLDSVFLHTLPFPPNLISRLASTGIVTAQRFLDELGHLCDVSAPLPVHLARQIDQFRRPTVAAILFVRTLATLGANVVQSLSARSWNPSPRVPVAPPSVLSEIANASSPEAEIHALAAELGMRDTDIVLSRLGLFDSPRPSLGSIAHRTWLTERRARRITTSFKNQVSTWHIRLPKCTKLVERIEAHGGIKHSSEILPDSQPLLTALAYLSALGVQPTLHWDCDAQAWFTSKSSLHLREYKRLIAKRLPAIRRLCGRWGAVPLDMLPQMKEVPRAVATQVALPSTVDWEIVDDLVVMPNGKSTLVRLASKAIAAIGPIRITQLLDALRGKNGFSPPSVRETKLILSSHGHFRVSEDDTLKLSGTVDSKSMLTSADRTAVEIIRKAAGVVDRDGFLQEMAREGIGTSRASAILRSPYITRLAKGVYGLLGDGVDQWRVRYAQTAKERRFRRSLVDHEQDWDGVWLSYSVTRPCLSGRLPLPAFLANNLRGTWKAEFSDGTTGSFSITGSTILGLRPWMQRAAVSHGVRIIVTIHEKERIIRLGVSPNPSQ